jgi:NAD(P)-dependent dehydrogenase (short-subunit alcohol dehydrogenase family)
MSAKTAEEGNIPSFRLDGRFAVITGASEGIGWTLAQAFARSGAKLLLAARRQERLDELAALVESEGGSAATLRTDVTNIDDLKRLGDRAAELSADGELPMILINNAGFGFTKLVEDVGEEEWDRLIDTHLKGTFFACQQIGRTMIARGYGKIINLGSAWGVTSDAGKVPYCTAKAGIAHMTEALATEWGRHGVRVNTLAPTATLTDFTANTMKQRPDRAERIVSRIKLGRFAEPRDLVGAALFLASEASDFVTGHTLYVDGGLTAGF